MVANGPTNNLKIYFIVAMLTLSKIKLNIFYFSDINSKINCNF